MALLRVNFTFHTGFKHNRFSNVRLSGSWDATGEFSNQWSIVPMALIGGLDRLRCIHRKRAVGQYPSGRGFPVGCDRRYRQCAEHVGGAQPKCLMKTRASATEVSFLRQAERNKTIGLSPDADSARRNISSRRYPTQAFTLRCGHRMREKSKWFSRHFLSRAVPRRRDISLMTAQASIRALQSCRWLPQAAGFGKANLARRPHWPTSAASSIGCTCTGSRMNKMW